VSKGMKQAVKQPVSLQGLHHNAIMTVNEYP